MFYLKRNGIYYVEFFDIILGKNRRLSTRSKTLSGAKSYVKNKLPLLYKEDSSEEQIQNDEITILEFKNLYAKFIEANYSANYLRSVHLTFRQLIRSSKLLYLSDLNARVLEFFLMDVFTRAKHSSHLYHRTLKAALNKAVTWSYIEKNPLIGIKPPRIPKNKRVYITIDEFNIILSFVNDKLLYDIYQFAYYSGLRLSEINNLKKKDISIDARIINVRNSTEFVTKSKKERMVPIVDKIFSIVNRRINLDEAANLFVQKSGIPYCDDFISKSFRRAVKKSNLEKRVNFHTLRHSFASNLVLLGTPINIVKDLLGHASITTTMIYVHSDTKNLIHYMKNLNKL